MSEKLEDRVFQLECLEVYKNLPALWKIKSDDYTNRQKKDSAYTLLVEKFREKYSDYTREDVKRKINAYRTNYRKELKKVQESARSGADHVYEPSLWYFHSLSFLNDQETPAKSRISSVQKPSLQLTADESDISHVDDTELSTDVRSGITFMEDQSTLSSPSLSSVSLQKHRKRLSSATLSDARADFLKLASERLRQGSEDGNLNQAKIWAAELSKMTPDQHLFARKAINDILFEGRLGTLKRDSVQIHNGSVLPYACFSTVVETASQHADPSGLDS